MPMRSFRAVEDGLSPGRSNRTALLLAMTVVLQGCSISRQAVGSHQPISPTVFVADTGGAGGVDELSADAFQGMQQAGGFEESARHPAGSALYLEQARVLWGQLAKTPVTGRSFAPRRALAWLLREVLAGGERVEYADLKWRAERFGALVLVRPDGYLVAALSGAPLHRLGSPRLVEGEWRVGRLEVGAFYFSRGGVFYPVNEALRRLDGPPLGELGLGRDPLNAALDGAQEAFGEMAVALAESALHPIRTVEDLGQLPSTVAHLIGSSPEYFARYGAMSAEDQVREAARLSTHLLLLFGGGEATVGRLGGLGAELPTLSLTARGELVLGGAAAAAGKGARLVGVPSVLHMAVKGPAKTGSGSGQSGTSSHSKGPGKWTYKTPTTESEQALAYQEQITGRPAWYVYKVGEVEFDGFNGKELLEAKGASYKKFLGKDGAFHAWFENGDGFKGLLEQARRQLRLAEALKLPLVWHVAEVEFANALRRTFEQNNLKRIAVRCTPPT